MFNYQPWIIYSQICSVIVANLFRKAWDQNTILDVLSTRLSEMLYPRGTARLGDSESIMPLKCRFVNRCLVMNTEQVLNNVPGFVGWGNDSCRSVTPLYSHTHDFGIVVVSVASDTTTALERVTVNNIS